MPITLDTPLTNPRWSKPLLLLLWIAQLLIILFLQFWTAILTVVVGASGGHKKLPWLLTATLIIMFFSQLAILFTIFYEFSWASSLAQLSAARFLKIQVAKSVYFLFFVVVILVSGTTFPGEGQPGVWGTAWRLGIFVGPFWGALAYAGVMMAKKRREGYVEFEYRDRPSSRGQA
ncbi:uncharacterized protein LY89DRAFT_3083 [Mollisia scopiformis]|uniref:Uncharacterized protein n=1 Tax=Mollisia scopiformis TaxID=149040 RepID=A0A194XTZ2_MOLSC|nr:uncharacterized protein LY89DRAFT_3083 [Mollisia scopiformis]KUJ23790.1 hypothetical protein LY89DRAFT_3083 [Mollisia scopiformis]